MKKCYKSISYDFTTVKKYLECISVTVKFKNNIMSVNYFCIIPKNNKFITFFYLSW